MCRAPPASERLPSGRGSPELRELRKFYSEIKEKNGVLEHELANAQKWRQHAERRTAQLEKELATEVAKMAEPTFVNKKLHITDLTEQSTNYYDHVEFLYKDLKRFETNMIPPLGVVLPICVAKNSLW